MTLLTGPCADAHLDEAQRQERHVISAEERVEEHFFDAAVEVGFELLHLAADELGRRRAAVCGHVLKTGEMITQVLSQQRQEVFGSRLRPVGAVLLGETAVGGSGLSATLLMEAAERHVNTEPESDTQRDRRLNTAHITERRLEAAKTSHKQHTIDNNTLYGSELYFFCYAKIMILRSCSMKIFCTVTI